MTQFRHVVLVIIIIFVSLPSCGYYRTTSRTAGDIKNINVPYFGNETPEPNIEIDITQRIIDGIIKDNTLKVVSDKDAEAILEGTIIEYRNDPFTFSKNSAEDIQAEQYRLIIGLRVSLFDRKKNEYVWKNKMIKAHGDYYLESSLEQNYEKALETLYIDLVNSILANTVQDW
jgi:Fe-S cluster assembly iron-binding protein IscA